MDGSRAFGYVPLARVRRWTFLVTIVTNNQGRPVGPTATPIINESAVQRSTTPMLD